MAGPVFAADLPVVEQAPPVAYEQPADFGGWYIRGDVDYHWSNFGGSDYITYGPVAPQLQGSLDGPLNGAFSIGRREPSNRPGTSWCRQSRRPPQAKGRQ